MTHAQIASNPFALMMNPEAIFAAIEQSDRLARLKSQICRPLDKPMVGRADVAEAAGAQDDVDAWLEAQASRLGDY
ncbi:MAG: hypothetical protein ABI671_12060 [Burkholderiales bacterium]